MFDNEKELMHPSRGRGYDCELQLTYARRDPFHITNWSYRTRGFGTAWNICEDHSFWTQDGTGGASGEISAEDLKLVIRIFEDIDNGRDLATTINNHLRPWGYRVEAATLTGVLLCHTETRVHITMDPDGVGAAEVEVPEELKQEIELLSARYFG